MLFVKEGFAMRLLLLLFMMHDGWSFDFVICCLDVNVQLIDDRLYRTCSRCAQISAIHLQKVQNHAIRPAEARLHLVLAAAAVAAQFVGGILFVGINDV